MKKRIMAALLSAVMVITGITGCDNTATSSDVSSSVSSTESSKEEASTTESSKEETSAPETDAPETSETEAPETDAPETSETEAPETDAPETSETEAPETDAPETSETEAPETDAPETSETEAPETDAPETSETEAPETDAPETSETEAPPPETPPTEYDVTQSADALAFAKKLMPGWNLGNQLEASSNKVPSETVWGNPTITEDLIKAVKAQGFKSIRIPVSYLSKIGDGPDYIIDKAWLDRIQEVVDMCVNNGLYAIINIHGDGYYSVNGSWLLCAEPEEDQVKIRDKYAKVWAQIAGRFKDYDEHLVFESMNEEFDGTYGWINPEYYENINKYNQIFVDTVRSAGGKNADRYVMVPGWNTDIDATVSETFRIPNDSSKKLMISVHYYAPYEFCLKEDAPGIFRWGSGNKDKSIRKGNENFVDEQFDKLVNSFVSKNIPVVIGEYGSIDKSYSDKVNTIYRAYFAEYVCYAATQRNIVTVYWDNGWNGKNGFGLFDRKDCSVTQPEIIKGIMDGVSATKAPTPPTD